MWDNGQVAKQMQCTAFPSIGAQKTNWYLVKSWYYLVLDNIPSGEVYTLRGVTAEDNLAAEPGESPCNTAAKVADLNTVVSGEYDPNSPGDTYGMTTYLSLDVAGGGAVCTTTPLPWPANSDVITQKICTIGTPESGNKVDFIDGYQCTLKCAAGYTKVGRIMCTDGVWVNSMECVTDFCTIPADGGNGNAVQLAADTRSISFADTCGVYSKVSAGDVCPFACIGESLSERTDAVQEIQIVAAGGTFKIAFTTTWNTTATTADIAFDATGAVVQAALDALSNVGHPQLDPNAVIVTDLVLACTNDRKWTITMKNAGAMPLMNVMSGSDPLVGGAASGGSCAYAKNVVLTGVTETTAGVDGSFACGSIKCTAGDVWEPAGDLSVNTCVPDNLDVPRAAPTMTSVAYVTDTTINIIWSRPGCSQNRTCCSAISRYVFTVEGYNVDCPAYLGAEPIPGGIICSIVDGPNFQQSENSTVVNAFAVNKCGMSTIEEEKTVIINSPLVSYAPTQAPTASPTSVPSASPTESPTHSPSVAPTALPTTAPTSLPSAAPSTAPSAAPSHAPSQSPSAVPSQAPTAGVYIIMNNSDARFFIGAASITPYPHRQYETLCSHLLV